MSLPLIFPTEQPLRRRRRQRPGSDVMVTGLLIGFCALLAAGLLLYALHGNGSRWMKTAEATEAELEDVTYRPAAIVPRQHPSFDEAEESQPLVAQSKTNSRTP